MKCARWLVLCAVLLGTNSCTNESAARKTLKASGYSQIEITGWSMFGCGKDDGTCTGFRAVGPTGVAVEGVVGCGFWGWQKGGTLRIEAQ